MPIRLWLPVAALLVGCSHKLDNPKPAVASLKPNLVCGAQLTTAVTVQGSGLTPTPTRTLAGGEVLAVPTVTLAQSTDLGGSPMSAPAVRLNSGSDRTNPHVRWESEPQMSFDVWPDLMLAAGVYNVTLTNPDGKTASLTQALAVVPPPSVTAVMPANVCDAQMMETVTLTGQNFLVVGTMEPEVDIRDANGMPVFSAMATASGCTDVAPQLNEGIRLCTTLTFQLPKDALPPGSYTLTVTNPAPAACASTESITFVVEPPPVLIDVLPSKICSNGGPLDLKGMSFLPTATAKVTDPATMQTITATTTVVSPDGTDALAKFMFAPALTPGHKLDVAIDNGDGCSSTLPAKVTVVSAPLVFYVDPPYVAAGVVTPVTVYTTGGITSLVKVLLIPHGQPATAGVDVTAASTIDGAHPKHIVINVPSTLAAGAYDLEIDSNNPCPAFYANALTVSAPTTSDLAVVPAFGDVSANVPVQITSTSSFIKPGARAYFAPSAATPPSAIALLSVAYHTNAAGTPSLSAIVPVLAPTPGAGRYDVIVVNPDGTIGRHAMAYTGVAGAVPTIDPTSPGSVAHSCTGPACYGILNGTNFNGTAIVDAICGATTFSAVPIVTNTPTALTLDLALEAAQGAGTTCTFRLTETVAAVSVVVTGGTLVVRNASGNLGATVATKYDLTTPRRGHGSAIAGPTAAARYLYVYGGDDGTTTTAGNLLSSVELAEIDPAAGDLKSTWKQFPLAGVASSTQGALPTARTFLGATAVGRFLYAIGGMTATGPTDAILRAESLDPAEAPRVDDADLTPDAAAGLAPGLYYYRVAALLDGSDPLNPTGETLASDEFAVNVPSFAPQKIDVTIAWKKAAILTNAGRTPTKWRVYRTTAPNATPGSEDEFADVDGATTLIVDVGNGIFVPAVTPPPPTPYAAGKPLPFGALGNWKATAFKLSSARAGAAVAHVVVTQKSGTGTNDAIYVGYGATNAGATTLSTSYDGFTVTVDVNNVPSETLVVSAGGGLTAGRWLTGGFGVMDTPAPLVWFGPGNGGNDFNHCTVDTTNTASYGALTCAAIANVSLYAYGPIAAVGSLFNFGGVAPGGVTDKIGKIIDDASSPSYSANGGGTIQFMAAIYPLAYEGAVLGGAYIWLTGGVTSAGLSAKSFFDLY